MKWAAFLFSLTLLCAAQVATAAELFIVTSETGYLLDENDQVADTVPFFHVFDINGEDGAYLNVRYEGQPFRIHSGLGHRTSQFAYIEESHLPAVKHVFELLYKSSNESEEDLAKGIQTARAAAEAAKDAFAQPALLEAWARQYQAYLTILLEDYDGAEQLLKECDAIVQTVAGADGPHVADIENTRGVLLNALGRNDESVAAYQKSVLLLLNSVGLNHHDTAVIHANLSYAHHENGNASQAIFAHQLSLQALRNVIPETSDELAAAHDAFGDLLRDNEKHDQAIQQFEIALALYKKHNPELVYEMADLGTDLIYSRTQSGDYDGAERDCESTLAILSGLSEEDESYFRRDITVRRGTIDYNREDFEAALEHYEAAAAMADRENYDDIDGSAVESIGDVYVKLGNTTRATVAYERAIDIFAITDGPESDTVLNLREYVDDLDSYRDDSVGGYVMVALPLGHLTDDDGKIIDSVPGLTLVEWYSSNDEFHEIQYKGKLGRISNSQLHTRRLIPGYGIGKAAHVERSLAETGRALEALSSNELAKAEGLMKTEIAAAEKEYGDDNSLALWLRIIDAGVKTRTQGPRAGMEALESIREKIDAINPQSYPLQIEALNAEALVLFLEGKQQESIELITRALEIAKERFGDEHAVVFGIHRTVGKRLFQANNAEAAEQHLREALRLSKVIYPDGSEEIPEAASDLSILLAQSGKLAEAAELLEGFLGEKRTLPKATHAMLVATLGKVYAGLDRPKDARQLLNVVVDVLRKNGGEAGINVPSGLMALSQLGKLDLAEGNWEDSAKNLSEAIEVAKVLGAADTFEASEAYRQLSEALVKLNRSDEAAVALKEVLRIYDGLGGGDSPQAEQIRNQIAQLDSKPAPTSILTQYFDLTPDGQAMFVTKQETSARVNSDGGADVVAALKAEEKVWSLATENGFHKVYLPDSEAFGWVADADLQSQVPLLIEKGRAKLRKELYRRSTLKKCMDAFEAARPEGGFEDPNEAIAKLEEAIKVLKENYKYSLPLTGLLYEDLLTYYQATGNVEKLAAAAADALSHLLSGQGYDHPATAEVRILLASHHRTLGQYFEEASDLREVLSACRKRFGPNAPQTMAQEVGYAANQIRGGFFKEATDSYTRIIEVEGNSESPSFLRAAANMGLGGLRASQRQYSAGAALLEKAAEEFEKLGNPVPPLLAQTGVALAFCVSKTGEGSESLQILERIEQTVPNPGDPSVQLSLLTMKARLAMEFDIATAQKFADQAVAFGEQAFGEDNYLVNDARHVAGLTRVSSDWPAAKDFLQKSREATHSYLHNSVVFQREGRRISFALSDSDRLNEALSYAISSSNDAAVPQAAEWLINGHNVLIESTAKIRQVRGRSGDTAEQAAILGWELEVDDKAEIPLKLLGPNTPPYLQDAIAELRSDKEFRQLKRATQRLITDSPAWISTDQLRENLNSDEVLIVFRRINDPQSIGDPVSNALPEEFREKIYSAWIIPAKGAGKIEAVTLAPEKPVDAMVDRLRSELHSIAKKGPVGAAERRKAATAERELLQQLAKAAWTSVVSKLPSNTSRLTICPDGSLHGIPWAAMPIDAENFAIDRFAVRSVMSPRDVIRTPESSQPTSQPVMFGRPEPLYQDTAYFDMPQDQREILVRRVRSRQFRLDRKKLGDTIQAGPDIIGELFSEIAKRRGRSDNAKPQREKKLREAFNSAFADAEFDFTGVKSSEYRFVTRFRPKAIHFDASPFAIVPEDSVNTSDFASSESRMLLPSYDTDLFSPLMQCGIMLTGYGIEEAKRPFDGVLTGEEIVSHDLRGTELVTLSVAPKSASGQPADAEVTNNVPHAFLLAGARSVVSGSWPLDEEVTNPLLQSFYRHLSEGNDKAEALRKAQQEIRAASSTGPVPVAEWASMQLIGEGWPLTRQAAAAGSSSSGSTEEDLRKLATQILKVYQTKDVGKLLAFTPDGPPSDAVLQRFAPGTSRFNSLFGDSSWRWQAVSAWDGKLPNVFFTKRRQPVSADEATEAHVEFGRSGNEVFVVSLVKVNGAWKFDDVHSPDASNLE